VKNGGIVMKKWLLYPMLSLSLLFTAGAPTASPVRAAGTDGGYTFSLDGAPLSFDVQPQLRNGTMMVPLRTIAEAMGAQITWNKTKQTITAIKDDTTLLLTINNSLAKRNNISFPLAAAPVIVADATLIPLRFFSEAFGSIVKWNGITKKITIENGAALLPVVGSYKNLQTILAKYPQQTNQTKELAQATESTAGAAPAAAQADSLSSAISDHSNTNVQVQGVDEADIVKTDGEYIYQVNKQRIIIAKASPVEQLKVTATLPFADHQFTPTELYLDETHLVVIGFSNHGDNSTIVEQSHAKRLTPIRNQGFVKALVYDISSKTNIQNIREIETEGSYITSRKIGANLYIIANHYINTFNILNDKTEVPSPVFRDTAASDAFVPIGYDHVRYFPDSAQPNYLVLTSLNLAEPNQKANVEAYLGSSQNVFASTKSLYVTLSHAKKVSPEEPAASNGVSPSIAFVPEQTDSTVYKFLLDQDKVRYTGSGEVPGTVLNQYAMDEYGGYFRIATTSGQIWRNDEMTSKNNVYVMNEAMEITGKIENIAPGERIYSTRFIGNRAYMVTFKQVDPLFVIDLANSQAPKILGSLKIPGYSDYLHPYDENHIIGFGKDSTEISNPVNGKASANATTAFYQGMKIAMFDVTDVTHPVELFKESIGDRGTDSEILRNPKALLFNKEKGLMAFPVTLMKVDPKNKDNDNAAPAYGQFSYQGAYIYHLDLTNGFTLKGTVTHLSKEDLAKAGGNWYYSDKSINRILYIGNTLYTLSNAEIKANDMNTLQEKNNLIIP
jgi:inhibitor of cysteine peptidase